MTTSIWLSIAIFGTLPFLLVVPDIGLANAFFESMSSITTTGSVMTGLDTTDRGILVYASPVAGRCGYHCDGIEHPTNAGRRRHAAFPQ